MVAGDAKTGSMLMNSNIASSPQVHAERNQQQHPKESRLGSSQGWHMSTKCCTRSVGCTAQCAAPSDQLQPAVARQLGQATPALWSVMGVATERRCASQFSVE